MYQRTPDHNAHISAPHSYITWSYDAKAKINGGLAIVDDELILDAFDHSIVALDLATGITRWRTTTDNIVMSTPVVSRGLVIVGTGHNGSMATATGDSFPYSFLPTTGQPPMWGRPQGDHILALDAASGQTKWSYRTAGEDMPSPAFAGDTIVFANGDFHGYGLDASTGTARWQQQLNGISTMASATSSDDTVYLSVCARQLKGETFAVHASTGKIKWRAAYGDCDVSPTVGGKRVFVSGVLGNDVTFGHGSRAYVAALDSQSGRLIWRYDTPEARPFTRVASNERAVTGVYASGVYYQSLPNSDDLLAFDAQTGYIRWHLRTTAPSKMSGIVAHGRLYVGDISGLLYVVDVKTGHLLVVRAFDEPFTTAPFVIVGDTLFFVNGSRVYARPLSEFVPTKV